MSKIAPSDGTPVKAEPTSEAEADEPVIGWRVKLMHKLDIYGATMAPTDDLRPVHPAMNPKNWMGAFFGTLFTVVYIALSIFYLYNFFDPKNEDPAVGEAVVWNGDCHIQDAMDLNAWIDDEIPLSALVDVPKAEVVFDTKIIFFEEDQPSLQRILVTDTTGYNYNFMSGNATHPRPIPKATAAATSQRTIALNSFNDQFQNTTSPNTPTTISLKDEMATAMAQAFTSETLKGMYTSAGILGDATDFFPHTAHLYIRFQRTELANIKKCQIQAQFMNSGVKDILKKAGVLNHRGYQDNATFPGLSVDNFMWASSSFPELSTRQMKWRYSLSKEECFSIPTNSYNVDEDEWSIEDENFDMLVVDTGLSMQDYEAITESREWGPEGVDTMWQARSVGVAKFTSWELSFSYVNNFVDVFTDYQCGRGGIPDFDFAFGGCEWEDDSLTSNEIYLTFVKYPFPGREPKSRDPFDLIVSSLYGEEVVTVTKWGYCAQDSKYCHGPKYDSRRQLDERTPTTVGSKLKSTSDAATPTGHHSQKLVSQSFRAALVPGKPNVVLTPPTLKSVLKSAATAPAPGTGTAAAAAAAARSTDSASRVAAMKEKADRAFEELMSRPSAGTQTETEAKAGGRRLLACSATCLGTGTCDSDWDALGCATMEADYGCDCSGCTCASDQTAAPVPVPTAMPVVTTGCSDFTLAGTYTDSGGTRDADGDYTFQGYYVGNPYYLSSDATTTATSGHYIYAFSSTYWLVTDATLGIGSTTYVYAASWSSSSSYSPIDVTDWQSSHDNVGTTNAAVSATSNGGSCPPTFNPTAVPVPAPTAVPVPVPTAVPVPVPTAVPVPAPTPLPTSNPTPLPTPVPTVSPTPLPTTVPTVSPTPLPTTPPSPLPTSNPTPGPSAAPTPEPSIPIVWDDGGAGGGEDGYADDNDDGDDAGIDPLFLLSFLTSGGNEPGYVKVDRTDTSIKHAGTTSGAFLYYVYGPVGAECPGGSCLPDGIPVDWKCDGANYFAADGVCNCGCGAFDPDCGPWSKPYIELTGCRGDQYCSLEGTCMMTNPADLAQQFLSDVDAGAPMKISDSCDFVRLPGEEDLLGYVGTAATDKVNPTENGECGACPGDKLYDFKANKDPSGTYVCNLAAEGLVNTHQLQTPFRTEGSTLLFDNEGFCGNYFWYCGAANDEWSDDGLTCSVGLTQVWVDAEWETELGCTPPFQMQLFLGEKTPFPEFHGNTTIKYMTFEQNNTIFRGVSKFVENSNSNYMVTINAGDANAEILHVTEASAAVNGVQNITVHRIQPEARGELPDHRKLMPPKFKHISYGALISVVDKDSTSIWIDTCNFESSQKEGECTNMLPGGVPFDLTGPYHVMIGDELMKITGAKTHPMLPTLQKLTLGSVISLDESNQPLGTSALVHEDLEVSALEIKVGGYHQNAGLYGGFGYNDCADLDCSVDDDISLFPLAEAIKQRNENGSKVKAIISFGAQEQYIEIDSVVPHGWTCPTRYWGDEMCDCGCGIYDPACGTPTESGAKSDAGLYMCWDSESSIESIGFCDYGTEGAHVVTADDDGGRRLAEDEPMFSRNAGAAAGEGRAVSRREKAQAAKANRDTPGFKARTAQRGDPRERRIMTKADNFPKKAKAKSPEEMSILNMTKEEVYRERKATHAANGRAAGERRRRLTSGGGQCVKLESGLEADTKDIKPPASATTDLFVDTIVLNAATPLSLSYPKHSKLEMGMWYDGADVEEFPGVGSIFDVVMYRPGESEYEPSERYFSTDLEPTESPPSLTVDVGIYMVPVRPTFAEAELCPFNTGKTSERAWVDQNPDSPSTMEWDSWKTRGDDMMSVTCVDPEGMYSEVPVEFDNSTCVTAREYKEEYPETYRKTCLLDVMPPTHQFSYQTRKPINGIWNKRDGDLGVDRPEGPAFNFEIEHRYMFAHDRYDDSAEQKFSQGGKSGGDTTNEQDRLVYTGARNVRGKGAKGSKSDTRNVPANNPYLETKATLDFRDIASKWLVGCNAVHFETGLWERNPSTQMGEMICEPKDTKCFKDTLMNHPDYALKREITWDTTVVGGSKEGTQILLEPGYGYTLSATIGIYPTYQTLQYFGLTRIIGYGSFVSGQTIERRELDYLERQEATVAYVITLMDDVNQNFWVHNSAFDTITAQLAAAAAYITLGLVIYKLVYMLTHTEERKEAYAHIKEAMAEAQALFGDDEEEEEEEAEEEPAALAAPAQAPAPRTPPVEGAVNVAWGETDEEPAALAAPAPVVESMHGVS